MYKTIVLLILMMMMCILLLLLAFACMILPVNSFNHNVLTVISQNITAVLSQQPLLLEFYAPWCSHCRNFEQSFSILADVLTSEDSIKVGRVDISANPALASLFEVKSVPVFYYRKENNIWKYENYHELSIEELLQFVRHDHASQQPLSMWRSPIGPVGWSKIVLIHSGEAIANLVPTVANYLGLSHVVAMFVIAIATAFGILSITLVGIYFSVVHAKND